MTPAGAKVVPTAEATLLPNIKGKDNGAEVFRIMSTTLHDDKQAFEFLCPGQVGSAHTAQGSICGWWALHTLHRVVHLRWWAGRGASTSEQCLGWSGCGSRLHVGSVVALS